MKQTQRDKVLQALQTGNWISTVDFVNMYILRAAARLWELRQEGYNIESRKVSGKTYDEYRLLQEPKQLSLL